MPRSHAALVLLGGVASVGLGGEPIAFGGANWFDDAYRAELRADAGERTSLLAEPEFPFDFSINLQVRHFSNISDGTPSGDELTTGFQISRARVTASGDVTDRIGYTVMFEGERNGEQMSLVDGYITWQLTDRALLTMGQGRVPFSREQMTSSSRQLTVDRSITDDTFAHDRSQLIKLRWRSDTVSVEGAISDGRTADNLEFTDPEEADFAVSARFDFLPEGNFRQFNDFSGFPGTEFGLLLGGGVHWQTGGETGIGPTEDLDIVALTADAGAEGDGWSAFAAGHFQRTDDAGTEFDDFGLLVQGGLFVAENTELFARYDHVFPDGGRDNDGDFRTFTAGVTQYLTPGSHTVKVTVEFMYMPDAQSESIVRVRPNLGVIASDEEQSAIRVQLQLRT